MIGVVVPTAAIVHHVIDTPYPVLAAYPQAHGIILPILGDGKVEFAEQRSIESAGSAQTVNTEGVVAAIFQCPFPMVDNSGRDGVQREIRNPVSAHHHGAVLLAEGIHELLYGILVAVEVVGIQLQGEAAAFGMMQGGIPVAADCVVTAVLGDIHQLWIPEEAFDDIHGSVGGIIIHHYHIVFEIRFLVQGAADRIAYGADPVLAWDYHRSLVPELPFRKVDILEHRLKISPDGLQMGRTGLFHLYLHLAVAGIHIVEYLIAGVAVIPLQFIIEELVYMEELAEPRNSQAKVVEAGELIVGIHPCDRFLEHGTAVHLHSPEIEIIAQRPLLIIYHRRRLSPVETVGVNHGCRGIVGYLHHTLHPELHETQVRRSCVYDSIFCISLPGDAADFGRAE